MFTLAEKEKIETIKIKKATLKKKNVRKVRRQRRVKDEIVHNFIPNHILLTKEEVETLEKKEISTDKLPLIFIADPAIRHLELNEGDVIKIIRKNNIIGDVEYYRRVIK